jgi:hypothetical protein
VSNLAALPFGLVLKPDRRQIPDRRRNRRGGRRASDSDGFEISSTFAADDDLAQVVATWGGLLRFNRISNEPHAVR